jgi:dihydrofolate reductase
MPVMILPEFCSKMGNLLNLLAKVISIIWLFVNPVLLGQGIPLFKGVNKTTKLKLIETKTFSCGVIALHYETKRN